MKNKVNKVSVFITAAFFLGALFPYAYSAADKGLNQFKTLLNVMDLVKENYVEDTPTEDLVENAAKGVLSNLDPFSEYLDKNAYSSLKSDTKGEFGGLGLRLLEKDGFLEITTPLPDTPAYEAGIMPGDRIILIDGADVKEMTQNEAVEKMRGKPGTKVKIALSRKNKKTGEYEMLPVFNLKRAVIIPQVVHFRMLDDKKTGYIHVSDFSGHTTEKLDEAYKELKKNGMERMVLDLRFNPGGLLKGAVDMAGAFLGGKELIVYTQGRKPEFYQEYNAPAKGKYSDIPVILLVNEVSASGSEIVAGALQDHKRAVLIGTRTFGKASVQQVFPLGNEGGVRLTIARYYTPQGRLIHRDYNKTKIKERDEGGIMPDIEVKVTNDEAIEVYRMYNNMVYVPGEKAPELPETKDNVLDTALKLFAAPGDFEEIKNGNAEKAAAYNLNARTKEEALTEEVIKEEK